VSRYKYSKKIIILSIRQSVGSPPPIQNHVSLLKCQTLTWTLANCHFKVREISLLNNCNEEDSSFVRMTQVTLFQIETFVY
jgi:hypothetical protein